MIAASTPFSWPGVTFTEAVRRLPAEQAARLQAEYRKPVGS
jgi:hypothetical protein